MARVSKLGALKVLDQDLWESTMKQAFEEGRTNAEANAWLATRGYGPVSDRALRDAMDEMKKVLGHSIRTERPDDPPPPAPWKIPCRPCKGFGRVGKDGRPSLNKKHDACAVCGGTGSVLGQGPRQASGGRLVGGGRQ